MYALPIIAFLASWAVEPAYAAATTKSFVTCVTSFGPKSTASVKTTSKVLTLPLAAIRVAVVTPKTTVTPKSTKTITVLETSTSSTTLTLPQRTSTVITTLTSSYTETRSETTIITATSTSTTVTVLTATTTIAAPAGFTPIEVSIPNSQKKRHAIAGKPIDARAELELSGRAAAKYILRPDANGVVTCSPAVYPTAVGCKGLVAIMTTNTITKTALKTRTMTAPQPTAFVTKMTVVVTTITELPADATSTVSLTASTTETVTNTLSITATIAEVATVTENAPQATFYAACAENNIISVVNGNQGLVSAGFDSVDSIMLVTAPSAYDCCAACLNTDNCGSTYWGTGRCWLLLQGDGCSPANQAFRYGLTGGGGRAYASNGKCGRASIA